MAERQDLATLLGIRVPVVQGGMIWAAGWRLAAAVSEAGGLGLIGAGSMTPDLLREHVRKCAAATRSPFGVNVPLLYPHAAACMDVIREEGVRIVFTSAGTPRTHTAQLRKDGIRVFHVVSSPSLARKCEDAGVDGLVAEGFEAGGHNGREELTTFVLIPAVRDVTTLPLLAAGGISRGAHIAAALALGADGVQIGTRFALTRESSLHDAFKTACLSAGEDATRLVMKSLVPVRLLRNPFRDQVMAAEAAGADRESLSSLLGRGRSRRGMFEGDLEEGELEIGQAAGFIRDVPAVAGVMGALLREWRAAAQSVSSIPSSD